MPMQTIRDYALQAWITEQERHEQARAKKAMRQAKKAEAALAALFPETASSYQVERTFTHPHYEAVITVSDTSGALQFTYDAKAKLRLLGVCPTCHQETTSQPITRAADLGKMLEHFVAGKAHVCAESCQ
jgi:hypothetical protein